VCFPSIWLSEGDVTWCHTIQECLKWLWFGLMIILIYTHIYIYIICINKYMQIYIQYTIYNYTYTCISYCTCKHTQKHTWIVTLYICKWEPYMLTLLTVSFDTFQQNHAFFIEGHWQKCWECLDLLAISTTYMYLYTHVWIMYMHATWCIHN